MKLTLINQYYPPDLAPTGNMAAGLAEHRAQLGDDVTVITSAGGYAGAEISLDPTRESRTRVIRIRTLQLGRENLVRRALDYLAFYVGALWQMSLLPAQDIVIALTTPPWIAWVGWVHKRLHPGSKLMIWTMDVYPEAAERFGAMQPGSVLSRFAHAASKGLLTRADAVVALDGAMKSLLTKRYALDQSGPSITLIPNWESEARYPADRAVKSWSPPAGINIEEQFTVLYMGNAGRGHDFGTLLNAVQQLGNDAVAFLFIGGGPQWKRLKSARADLDLRNLHLLDYLPRESATSVMSKADCGLIVLRDDALGVMSPSKLHGYLAMSLPVIYVGPEDSNVDEAIKSFDCGISLRHGDAEGMVRFISDLAADPDQKRHVGLRARAAFEERYSDTVALAEFDHLLQELSATS